MTTPGIWKVINPPATIDPALNCRFTVTVVDTFVHAKVAGMFDDVPIQLNDVCVGGVKPVGNVMLSTSPFVCARANVTEMFRLVDAPFVELTGVTDNPMNGVGWNTDNV